MDRDKAASPSRVVVVSNRLPIRIVKGEDGELEVRPGAGGLVTALRPVLRSHGGMWIGWLGDHGLDDVSDLLDSSQAGYQPLPVALTRDDIQGYYEGLANDVLWPLFHDFASQCNFDPSYWPAYERVNRKFAAAIAEHTEEDDYLWIHDYHLMLVARELAALGVRRKLGFFLHIPFPPPDLLVKLPWRQQLIEGLLQFDLLGFQTPRDRRKFVDCVRVLVEGSSVSGTGSVRTIRTPDREVRAGAFPISIDYDDFLRRAVDDDVSETVASVRARLPNRQLILGLDRLDYTKGIPHRIRAFGHALERFPELRGKVTLLQVVVPSRPGVEEYQHIKDDIDRLVGSVNGRFTQAGWSPIQYIFRSLSDTELLAYYRACHVALVTPLKDGMNLVAKEYCACSIENEGVLILSEFAGAAAQLGKGALLVNPYDIEATAQAIRDAVLMGQEERRRRMRGIRKSIKRNDVFRWVHDFLDAAGVELEAQPEGVPRTTVDPPSLPGA